MFSDIPGVQDKEGQTEEKRREGEEREQEAQEGG